MCNESVKYVSLPVAQWLNTAPSTNSVRDWKIHNNVRSNGVPHRLKSMKGNAIILNGMLVNNLLLNRIETRKSTTPHGTGDADIVVETPDKSNTLSGFSCFI